MSPGASRMLTFARDVGTNWLMAWSTGGASSATTVIAGCAHILPAAVPLPTGCTPSTTPNSARYPSTSYGSDVAADIDLPVTAIEPSSLCREASSRFMTINQVGCDVSEPVELLRVPYGGGTVDGKDDNVEVRARVKSVSAGNQIDIVQARIGYRIVESSE